MSSACRCCQEPRQVSSTQLARHRLCCGVDYRHQGFGRSGRPCAHVAAESLVLAADGRKSSAKRALHPWWFLGGGSVQPVVEKLKPEVRKSCLLWSPQTRDSSKKPFPCQKGFRRQLFLTRSHLPLLCAADSCGWATWVVHVAGTGHGRHVWEERPLRALQQCVVDLAT